MDRRQLLLFAASGAFGQTPVIAQAAADLLARLKKGGCAVMLRHAQTEPGVGDPAGYHILLSSHFAVYISLLVCLLGLNELLPISNKLWQLLC